MNFINEHCDMKKKKAGRPKKAKKEKKVRFSVTLHPNLIERIEKEVTISRGRNSVIEETLDQNLPK